MTLVRTPISDGHKSNHVVTAAALPLAGAWLAPLSAQQAVGPAKTAALQPSIAAPLWTVCAGSLWRISASVAVAGEGPQRHTVSCCQIAPK